MSLSTSLTVADVVWILLHSFLGSKPVKLSRVTVQGSPAILALSSRPWLNYVYRGILQFTPLIFDALDYAWSFSAELCPEGLIGVVGNSLRFVWTLPSDLS